MQAVQADKVRLGVGTVGHTGLGLLVGLAKALVQLVQRVGAAVQAGGVAVEFGGRDPGKLFDRLALNGGKLGRGMWMRRSAWAGKRNPPAKAWHR